MNVIKYLAPLEDGILASPQTSKCTKPCNLLALEALEVEKGYLCCLPNTQLLQKFKFSWDLKVSPSTKFLCTSSFMSSTPNYPSHWCHKLMH